MCMATAQGIGSSSRNPWWSPLPAQEGLGLMAFLMLLVGFAISIFGSVYAESRVKPAFAFAFCHGHRHFKFIAMQFIVKTLTNKSVTFDQCLAMQSFVQTLTKTQCIQCSSFPLTSLLPWTSSFDMKLSVQTSPTRPLSWSCFSPRSSLSRPLPSKHGPWSGSYWPSSPMWIKPLPCCCLPRPALARPLHSTFAMQFVDAQLTPTSKTFAYIPDHSTLSNSLS